MSEKFEQAFKSTIDKVASHIASIKGLSHIDIDDLAKLRLLTDTTDTVIVSHFQTLISHVPRMYKGSFGMGAKISSDTGNYTLLGLLGNITEAFPVSRQFIINDWSGVVVSPMLGSFVIRSVAMQNNDAFGDSNVRFMQFEIEAFEFI